MPMVILQPGLSRTTGLSIEYFTTLTAVAVHAVLSVIGHSLQTKEKWKS
jgi:hypothetical protein